MLTASEKQLLFIFTLISKNETPLELKRLEERGTVYFCSCKLNWEKAFESLREKKILQPDGGGIIKGERFDPGLVGTIRPKYMYWYNHWYCFGSRSEAHKMLCQHSYGIDLCQTGMMTKIQLDYLCSQINEGEQGLDLGCGIGRITEYVSNQTRASLHGVDTIVSGIKGAKRKTGDNDLLFFSLGMMQEYVNKTERKYDFILSMDTIYFLGEGFDLFLTDCRKRLKADGRIYLFYSAWEHKDEKLESSKTKVGTWLEKNSIQYELKDFTEDDLSHWIRKRDFLKKNKTLFLKEGNELIYERRLMEAEYFPNLGEIGKMNRYLYIIY